MTLTVFCGITFGISLFITVGAIILSIYRHVSYIKSNEQGRLKHRILTPLQISLIGVFFALVVLFYPVYYADYFSGEHSIVNVLKSVLLSAQNALQVFTLNANFDGFKDLVSNSERVNSGLGMAYTIYATIMYVLAPAMIASFILSLFKETCALIRYAMHIRSDIYIMSELNEKSITLATDIKTNTEIKGKKVIVFADVQKKDEEEGADLIAQAERLGAICFKRDITGVSLKRRIKNICRKMYFISENEDDNISQALDVIADCLGDKNLNTDKTELYIFARNIESETLLNSTDIGNMKVRRVNDNKNLAWQTLRKASIFADAEFSDVDCKEKKLNIVIVGCGNYGTELLKTICWLGQMPTYSLTVHVFDKEKNIKERIKCIAPELISNSGMMQNGESNYTINFYPETDVNSFEFIDKLKELEKVTSVFITLGRDELNIDTAIRIRIEFLRDKQYDETRPAIYPVVYSKIRSAIASSGSKLVISSRDEEQSYNLKFIGNIDTCYSLENIEQSELEKLAESYHLIWANRSGDPGKIKSAISKFNKYEYYRASSMAQAIYIEYLKKLKPINKIIFEAENKVLFNEYEHRRWNAYMRAEGYVYAVERYDLAKMHGDLKPFDELSDEDKAKDEVWSVAIKQ